MEIFPYKSRLLLSFKIKYFLFLHLFQFNKQLLSKYYIDTKINKIYTYIDLIAELIKESVGRDRLMNL